MDEQEQAELVKAAMNFYHSALSPTPADFERLFAALVSHDHGELEDLLEQFGVPIPWVEAAETANLTAEMVNAARGL